MSLPVSEEHDSLNELQKKLEQGTLANVRLKRSHLSLGQDVQTGSWPEDLIEDFGETSNSNSWKKIKNFLVGAVVFFVISLGIASIVLLKGGNLISNSNIKLDVRGPVSIKSGEILHLQLGITNNNRAGLEAARILAEYPDGTRSALDVTQELKRGNYELGEIKTGETVNKSFDALVFGSQGNQQAVKLVLEYRLAGSNNVFSKEQNFTFTISDAPITMSIDFPNEMNAGREFEFTINLVSNSPTILSDLLLDISYPPGFQLKSSDISPAVDGHIWHLGDLGSGANKKIIISGVLSGQENEAKSFRFVVGPSRGGVGNETVFAYSDILKNLIIRNPFVGGNLAIGNKKGIEVAVAPGENLNNKVEWVNNLSSDIKNLRAEVSLSGSIIDRRSIRVEKGFYRSQDDKILWDKNTLDSLSSISAGQMGRANFSFSILPLSALKGSLARNPQATLSLILIGERLGINKQSEEVKTEINKTIRVASIPQIASQLTYNSGPFTNSGPVSPRVDQQTTYTVNWSVANPSNEVKGVKVVATLPNYVSWQSNVSTQSENLTFNESTREITWDLGIVPAGTGFESSPREVSFQIAFTPSLSQVGETPELVSSVVLSGTDSFANVPVTSSRSLLTTKSLNEPNLEAESGVVSE